MAYTRGSIEVKLIGLCSATEYADVDMSYCLIESQGWVGSDVIRPDCTSGSSDPSCADPTDVSPDDERLANLYGNDVV